MMSKSLFTLLLLFLADSISMSAIEKLLVCEQMLLSTISEKLLAFVTYLLVSFVTY
jgi:hypothetical protein